MGFSALSVSLKGLRDGIVFEPGPPDWSMAVDTDQNAELHNRIARLESQVAAMGAALAQVTQQAKETADQFRLYRQEVEGNLDGLVGVVKALQNRVLGDNTQDIAPRNIPGERWIGRAQVSVGSSLEKPGPY